MNLFENILFPVDFSHRSEALAPLAAATAERFRARLTLLHVLDLPRPGEEPPFADIVEEYMHKLRAFGAAAFNGRFVHPVLRTGRPAKEILRYVEEENIDLVLMATHGFTRFRQLLLGSVTASVLHDAECAVWTTAHTEDAGAIHADVRKVVCAVDMGPRTVDLLAKAKEVANAYGAPLSVVHSVPAVDPRFYSEVAAHAHRFLVDSARREYPALAAEAGVTEPLEDAGLAASVAAKCEAVNADLLVIGRGHARGVLGRLRTNSHDLIRLSPCPVLSL
jgi:universal stress protein A